MSNELTIDCPNCGQGFELTEALAGPMLEEERRKARDEGSIVSAAEREAIAAAAKEALACEHAAEIQAKDNALAEQAATVKAAEAAELAARQAKRDADDARERTELEVVRRVDAQRAAIAAEAAQKATTEADAKLAAAHVQLAEKDAKLVAAQSGELEALRLKAEADETLREAELTIARRLEEERGKVRDQAIRERDEEYRLKGAEKDAQIRAMQEQIEELRRTGAVTSQQLVGDVQEVDLLITLSDAFPMDRFERVKKGLRGADVLQTVMSVGGATCGTILWESKRTKNWSETWLSKLREDQRDAKAEIAALATETLPDGQTSFEERDGVWVMLLNAVVPVACALRRLLVDVATARRAGALADTTKDHVFAYLTSPQFRQRVSRIVEGYEEMRADLDKEKRATATAWNKREKQLERILGGMTGFYGDLQGIVGTSLPAVDGLMLAAPQEAAGKLKLTVVNSDAGSVADSPADPLLS
jgi:hypothetical protein